MLSYSFISYNQVAPSIPVPKLHPTRYAHLHFYPQSGDLLYHDSEVLPDFISRYAGDTLWALMVFLVIGFLFPSLSTWKVAAIALLFSLLIETSQLYHAPWLEEIRRYRLAALILGRGFLWSDLGCYSVGVTLGILLEKLIINMNYKINAIKLRIKSNP
jgi:glycopeptide antibiotics resistance protein